MKKRIISILCVIAIMVGSMCIGAMANGGIEEIKAYLNKDITIRLDGQVKTMHDAQGTRVYPISYKGTTYVPIRAVSNMLGIDVEWDGANRTVLLGKTGVGKNFIEELAPYYRSNYAYRYTEKDAKRATIAGKDYLSYLILGDDFVSRDGYVMYDLGGKYTKLTFSAYVEKDTSNTESIQVFGDNDELIADIAIKPQALPKSYEINVTGVTQLTIKGVNFRHGYIFDATIE